jgi:hypothetical protein
MLNSRELTTIEGGALATGMLTSAYDTSLLLPILSLNEVQQVRPGVQSAKVPANVILAPTVGLSDPSKDVRELILDFAHTDEGMAILQSQFLDEVVVGALQSGDLATFLDHRASLIADAASELVGYEPS